MKQHYVYRHIRLDTNEVFYIGIGKTKKFSRAYSVRQRNRFWNFIVDKTEYTVEILAKDLSFEEACDLEKLLISEYGRRDLDEGSLVNLTDGGEGVENLSEEARQKIKNRMGVNHPNKGRKWSKEIRKRMSEGKKGICSGEDHYNYGKKVNENTRKLMSENHADFNGENNPNWGKKRTKKWKKQHSKLMSEKNNSNKKVIDLDTKIIYNSIKEAAGFIGIHKDTLSKYLRGKAVNKTSMQYYEKYKGGNNI